MATILLVWLGLSTLLCLCLVRAASRPLPPVADAGPAFAAAAADRPGWTTELRAAGLEACDTAGLETCATGGSVSRTAGRGDDRRGTLKCGRVKRSEGGEGGDGGRRRGSSGSPKQPPMEPAGAQVFCKQ